MRVKWSSLVGHLGAPFRSSPAATSAAGAVRIATQSLVASRIICPCYVDARRASRKPGIEVAAFEFAERVLVERAIGRPMDDLVLERESLARPRRGELRAVVLETVVGVAVALRQEIGDHGFCGGDVHRGGLPRFSRAEERGW